MRRHPHVLEINAWLFVRRLSRKYGKTLTLVSIPETEWKRIAGQGFDAVWLMGVWQRSPGSRDKALHEPALRRAYDAVLPDWKPEDIAGSPYAVYAYEIDGRLGRPGDLEKLRSHLNRAGLKLILDFVPNHLALDHPAALTHPEYFIEGNPEDAKKNPGLFFQTAGGRLLAHGKDPFFDAWSDSVQINFFSEAAREFLTDELLKIAGSADGVRCDMAMLGLNAVFAKTWGRFISPVLPEKEFWAHAVHRVKHHFRDFVFMAEVYWDREWELQQLGFHFTYDKKLYDRLLHGLPEPVLGHLHAEAHYQEKSVRFIENHDERRAAEIFGPEKSRAAAVIMSTVPGMRFFYDGQMQGRKLRLPVQLGREPEEQPDPEMESFYERLLDWTRHEALHEGKWHLLKTEPHQLLAWCWQYKKDCKIVIVNYWGGNIHGKVRLLPLSGHEEIEVRLGPWGFDFLDLKC